MPRRVGGRRGVGRWCGRTWGGRGVRVASSLVSIGSTLGESAVDPIRSL